MAMDEVDLMYTISGNIRSLMEETGYSRKELSRDTGIPESSISYYIRGKKYLVLKLYLIYVWHSIVSLRIFWDMWIMLSESEFARMTRDVMKD